MNVHKYIIQRNFFYGHFSNIVISEYCKWDLLIFAVIDIFIIVINIFRVAVPFSFLRHSFTRWSCPHYVVHIGLGFLFFSFSFAYASRTLGWQACANIYSFRILYAGSVVSALWKNLLGIRKYPIYWCKYSHYIIGD